MGQVDAIHLTRHFDVGEEEFLDRSPSGNAVSDWSMRDMLTSGEVELAARNFLCPKAFPKPAVFFI
jgi:hypothetical protein